MRMQRFLALLCSLYFILSSLSSGVWAVDTLDDLGIDPWGDLGLIQQTPAPDGDLVSSISEDGEYSAAEIVEEEVDMIGEGGEVFSLRPNDNTFYVKPTDSTNQMYLLFLKSSTSFTSPYTDFFGSYNTTRSVLMNGHSVSNSYYWTGNYQLLLGNVKSKGYLSYDVFQNVDLAADLYTSFTLNGYASFSFGCQLSRSSSSAYSPSWTTLSISRARPAYCQVLVNGLPFGKKVLIESDGDFFFNNLTVDFSSLAGTKITSVGYRFFFEPMNTTSNSTYQFYSSPALGWSGSSSTDYYYFYRRLTFFDDSELDVAWNKSDSGLISGGDNNGSSAEDDQARHEETKGLLGSIISFLQNIVNGIGNMATAIAALPGKIATAILDGIKSLFIPSQEDLEGMKEKYQALLSERLGFIWQAGEWVLGFAGELLSALAGGAEAEFLFPGVGFDMNGEHYQLIEKQAVDFGGNGIVSVIRPFTGTIVAMVVVIACVNLFRDMVTALISGKSFFDFLKGGGSS